MVVRLKVSGNGHSFSGERRSGQQLARSYFLHQGLTLDPDSESTESHWTASESPVTPFAEGNWARIINI